MNLRDRVKSWLGGPYNGAQEGQWRGPFFGVGELGSMVQLDQLEDGWQRHVNVSGGARGVAPVYACAMLYARTVSQCWPKHVRGDKRGAFEEVDTTPASRVFRAPNDYETWAQLILNTVADMMFEGQSGWVAVRDDRNAITAVHRVMRGAWAPTVDPETGSVFYAIGDLSNGLIPKRLQMAVPAREFAHFRMHTPRHPLIGESPVVAAALAVGINVALSKSQVSFFNQMRRPSGILGTDTPLNATQMAQLRAAFDEQAKGWSQGKVPILSNGLKFYPMSVTSTDAQLIEAQKMSVLDIARVFGVPMALLSEGSGPQGGTEALINHWLSTGLGAVLESIERTLDRLFDLPRAEYIELDTAPLLRTDFAGRIDGLTKAITGGLLSPNEAREREGLAPVKFGDEPRLQAQVVPLSQVELAKPATSAPAPGNTVTSADDEPEDEDEESAEPPAGADDDEERGIDAQTAADIARATLLKALKA
jgi:HK97 family phage portal protein